MIRKKLFFSASVVLSIITFLGCGGSDSSNTKHTPSTHEDEYRSSSVIIENGKPSEAFKSLLASIPPIQANYSAYNQIEKQIKQNKAVDLILEYKNINPSLFHITFKSNNTPIGENFIFVDTNTVEVLAQLISNESSLSKSHKTNYKDYFSTDKIWNKSTDQTIIADSLKNHYSDMLKKLSKGLTVNPLIDFLNRQQNLKYLINFTLQKTSEEDYNLSNITIAEITLSKNNFILKKDKTPLGKTSFLYLQPVLSTLFANFEKSKDILD